MSKIASVVNNTKIEHVATRKVGEKNSTIWDVYTPDGTKWSTFKADVGNKADSLTGQICDLSIEIEQKGDFTNYNLINIRPAGGAQAASQPTDVNPVVAAALAAQTAQQAAPAVSYEDYKSIDGDKEKRRTESIHRQTAAKVAAALLPGSPDEFWANVTDLVTYFASGISPNGGTLVPTGVTSHTPPADQDPAWGDAPPPDDIPFMATI